MYGPNLKDGNLNFHITWKIFKQALAYKPSSKRCNLCLWKKFQKYVNSIRPFARSLCPHVDTLLNLCGKISSLLLHNRICRNSVVSVVTSLKNFSYDQRTVIYHLAIVSEECYTIALYETVLIKCLVKF